MAIYKDQYTQYIQLLVKDLRQKTQIGHKNVYCVTKFCNTYPYSHDIVFTCYQLNDDLINVFTNYKVYILRFNCMANIRGNGNKIEMKSYILK